MWEAFFRQTGAPQVGSMAEMIALTSAMLHLRPARSARAAVLAVGGGSSVATGDVCAQEGIEVPPLSPATAAGIREFVSLVNQGVGNPLDVPGIVFDVPTMRRMFDLLADDPLVDFIILHLGAEFFAGPMLSVLTDERIMSFIRDNPRGTQVVVAVSNEGHARDSEKPARDLREAGIMAFSSLESACKALRGFTGYHRFIATDGSQANR